MCYVVSPIKTEMYHASYYISTACIQMVDAAYVAYQA